MLIKDLTLIKELSKKNEDTNWRFRTFLKGQDGGDIDALVKPIYERVKSKIDCRECGNCCRELQPTISKKDMTNLQKALHLPNKVVYSRYIERDEFDTLLLKGKPCVFLKGNDCQVFDARPEDCQTFPFLHKKDFTHRLIGVIEHAEICPIVFNVWEELKSEFNYPKRYQ